MTIPTRPTFGTAAQARKIRVLVVDDSALARRAIVDALSHDPAIEVVGVASDPYIARDRILELEPDVITLDLEMPRMDGLTFLRILQEHHPLPVVVVSSLTQAGSEMALAALHAGAIDVIGKPDGSRSLGAIARQLTHVVKAAARSRRGRVRDTAVEHEPRAAVAPVSAETYSNKQILLIGSSTGGVEALRYLLPQLPAGLPPIVVVQHIPAHFSRTMADHLNSLCAFEVREAVDGDDLRPGLCLVAPGDFHVVLNKKAGRGYGVRLTHSPPVHYCRPSVDVTFRSGAEQAGANAVAVILTGMGSDGARGMQMLRGAGARTFAESEESCIVFGMPRAAIELGAAEQVLPLQRMPQAILRALAEVSKR
jgi:two-component system chemotaxis response regulator CheB